MLSGEKILVTGITGVVALPIAQALAADNEVWGLARFSDPGQREAVSALGITPLAVDFAAPDFSQTPTDFTYILHFGWMRGTLDQQALALRVNVQAPGLMLQHCHKAKAALIVSSQGVYAPNPDPEHRYVETDPVGRAFTAYAQTSPACKLGLESVARFCAEAFNLPVTIARLNTVLGPTAAYHGNHVRSIMNGQPIMVPDDPNLHSPIHQDDMTWQIEPLLKAASTRAVVTNWCGDEVVSTQNTSAFLSDLIGKPAHLVVRKFEGAPSGNANDATLRRSITGACTVTINDGLRRVHAAVVAEQKAA
jgi:nucleoside-diphosphate-sugar epimerase